MEIQYYGANCVRLTGKKASIVIDDNLADLGLKSVTRAGDIVLFTGAHGDVKAEVKLVIDQPGEYEVSDISVQGIGARAHMDETGLNATMYKVSGGDLRIAVVGHIFPDLSDKQLEELGMIDILVIPVGGNGYTLDATGALQLIKKIEPKLVVPTHYADKAVKYPVPQAELGDALKNMAMEPKETVAKLKVKPAELTDTTQLAVLERQ
jgi:L-ascorbate metabolism protein UlaG (beta-lactamase superfamily)